MKYLFVLLAALGLAYGSHAWFRGQAAAEESALLARIEAAPAPVGAGDLPQIVRDFVRVSGAREGALARIVRLTQEAEVELEPGGGFEAIGARQWIATGEAAFVWLADRPYGPLTLYRITDTYVDGIGQAGFRALGSFPLGAASGPDIDRAEAMRYLAELAWVPDAILGNPDLVWRYVSPREVAVAMASPAGTVEVTLVFDAAGDIAEILAKDRPASDRSGETVLRDWRGVFGDWGEMGGRRIPRRVEVGYVYEDGYRPYFRGRITSYEVVE